MGNAMDFLEKRGTVKTKANEVAEAQHKINRFIEENEPTILPDNHIFTRIISQTNKGTKRIQSVDSQKNYFERLADKEGEYECQCCTKSFIPIFKFGQRNQHQKDMGFNQFSIYCMACTQAGSEFRHKVRHLKGGIKEYKERVAALLPTHQLSRTMNLYELFSQLEHRRILNKDTKSIDKLIKNVILQAYQDNKDFDIQKRTQQFEY